ncbi:MAG: hypothetical protein ABIO24_07630, partial [Saprospiraceae bacterium]
LLTLIPKWGFAVQEKAATFARLLEADELFLTNAVRGIQWVERCEDKYFNSLKTKILYELLVAEFNEMDQPEKPPHSP